MKKYEFTGKTKSLLGVDVKEIRYVRDISIHGISIGDIGGYLESEDNLSHDGACVVVEEASVMGLAIVKGNAHIKGNAMVSQQAIVGDYARISGYAVIYESARILGEAIVTDDARISGTASVSERAQIKGDAQVFGNALVAGVSIVDDRARVYGNAILNHSQLSKSDSAHIFNQASIYGSAKVFSRATVKGNSKVFENAIIRDGATICDYAVIKGKSIVCGFASVSKNAIVTGESDVDIKAVITDQAELTDAKVSGNARIEGKSSLSKGCAVYGDSRIYNSTLKTGVEVLDQAVVENSVLIGQIILTESAKISHCDIEGNHIRVEDDAFLHSVQMENVSDIQITNKAVLSLAILRGVHQMKMFENAKIRGANSLNRNLLIGEELSFSGMCRIEEGVAITGTRVAIKGNARLKGEINVGSDVTVSEFAEIENIKPNAKTYILSNTEMSMDTSIIL